MTTNSDCRRSSKEGVRIIVDMEACQSRQRGRRGRGVEGGGGRRHHKEGNNGDVTGPEMPIKIRQVEPSGLGPFTMFDRPPTERYRRLLGPTEQPPVDLTVAARLRVPRSLNPVSLAGREMASPHPVAALTDDILAEIFLRLPEPADLVRASAACVPYRRLAADRAFLRRFRSLHPAPLLGFLDHSGFHPALPPHASAPAARAVSGAADFSFSFLPSSAAGRWVVRDVRDGRILLDRAPEEDRGEGSLVFTEVVVCDPLHRRCVVLPPIPDDLAASVEHRPLRVEFDRCCEAFLVPRGDDGAGAAEETSFEVIWMAQCKAKLVAFAFSSTTGQWRAVESLRWRDLMSGAGAALRNPVVHGRQYARGCFYWVMDWCSKLLVLDTRRMEFSIADLPPGCHRRQIAIVEAGEDRVGMFALRDHIEDGAVSLHYMVRHNSSHWQMEKIIPLDPGFRHYIRGATERYLLLLRFPEDLSSSGVHVISSEEGIDLECFSMDVKTSQLEKLCGLKHHILRAHLYTNFPPLLSSPTI